MPDPATYRPAPGSIPEAPGVYRFSDAHGRVIYVGKAKSLRQRLNSYFADLSGLHPRTRQMVTTAAHVQWTVVTTEVEALQLEYNWIKEFDPRFNVRYRDDKTYPVLAVTMNEEFPRLHVYRGPRRKGVRYFGPVRPRLGHPRDARPAAARLPRPHLQRRGVQAARPDRPALPARLHRQVLRALRRAGRRRRAPPHRRGLLRLPLRPHRPPDPAAGAADGARRRRSWSSSRRPACATTSARCAAPWSARPWCSATAPTPTWSRSPRTSWRPRSRSSTCAAAGCAASAAG